MRIRRFGQIIRQAGHFGKRPGDINSEYQIRSNFRDWESLAYQFMGVRPVRSRGTKDD
jgi:hypothetical protein